MILPFIVLLLPEEKLSINVVLINVILRLMVGLGVASNRFMLRINSGLMGNLAQAQILPQVRKWSGKKGP